MTYNKTKWVTLYRKRLPYWVITNFITCNEWITIQKAHAMNGLQSKKHMP